MKKHQLLSGVLSLILVPVFVTAITQVIARISEGNLRKIALKTVMPKYPVESIKRRAKGVAVARLVFDTAGIVTEVEILEAPDELIKKATIEAVKQWTFKPTRAHDEHGPLIRIQGKLTFYFVIGDNEEPRVENPKQYQ